MRLLPLFGLLGLDGLYGVAAQGSHWWDDLLATLRVPPAFAVSVYADSIPSARTVIVSPSGMVFSSQGRGNNGQVWACRDANNDGDALDAGECFPISEGLVQPNGLAFMHGNLYIALIDRVLMIRDVEVDPTTIKVPELVLGPETSPGAGDGLPAYNHHGWRYLTGNPATGELAIAIGAPCNVPWTGSSDPGIEDCGNQGGGQPLLATIATFAEDGTNLRVVARGVRNSVGITYHPDTEEIWFTDNGRDQWGSSGSQSTPETSAEPPDELCRLAATPSVATNTSAQREIPDYGFPACYGRDLSDDAIDGRGQPFNPTGQCDPAEYIGAVANLPSHSAALGVRFYNESQFPARYQGRAFIAEHGSWNRWPPSGYAVSTVVIGPDPATATAATGLASHADESYEEFLTGFRAPPGLERRCTNSADCPGNSTCQTGAPPDGQFLKCGGRGRPVDVEVMRDGSILISDDMNSLIYRVSYIGPPTAGSGSRVGDEALTSLVTLLVVLLGIALVGAGIWLGARRGQIGIAEPLKGQNNNGEKIFSTSP